MLKRLIISALLWLPGLAAAKAVYVLPIEGMIDLGLAPFVKRVINTAEKTGAEAVLIKVNTFGGRVDAAVQIKDAILNSKVKTIAFVDKRAISAGALISLSAQQIVMAPGATIGAATPVDMQGKKLSEKEVSYMRAELRATAEKNKRPIHLAEAMVDESLGVDSLLPKGQLLTLTTEEALKHKIADYQAASMEEALKVCGLADAQIIEYRANWAEKVVRFLTNPVVSSLLLTLGMLGLIFEVKTPGWGIGGTIGVIALALFFGSHFIIKLAGWGEILLFVAGIALIIAEVFVVPGFGITGLLGIAATVAAIFFSLIGHIPSQAEIITSLYAVVGTLAATIAGAVVLFRTLPKSNVLHKLVLDMGEKRELGFQSSGPGQERLIGQEGIAVSDLRPSGLGQFGDERYDIMAEGEYVPQGTALKVIKVEGSRIVVKKADKV